MLDEIGELSEEYQAHLLRVLDNRGQYHRLGETEARHSNFRMVAATNRDPALLKHDFLALYWLPDSSATRCPILQQEQRGCRRERLLGSLRWVMASAMVDGVGAR